MPGNAAKVVVTERQENVLTEFSKSRSVPQQLAERATMVMLSFQGLTNERISRRVGVNRLQVGLWRRRWRDNWESLTLLECREPLKLREAIREVFRDSPPPGSSATCHCRASEPDPNGGLRIAPPLGPAHLALDGPRVA